MKTLIVFSFILMVGLLGSCEENKTNKSKIPNFVKFVPINADAGYGYLQQFITITDDRGYVVFIPGEGIIKFNSHGDTLWTFYSSTFFGRFFETRQNYMFLRHGGRGTIYVDTFTKQGIHLNTQTTNFGINSAYFLGGAALEKDGEHLIVGISIDAIEDSRFLDLVIVRTDLNLNVIKMDTISTRGSGWDEYIRDIKIDDSGTMYLGGDSPFATEPPGYHEVLIRMDADWNISWITTEQHDSFSRAGIFTMAIVDSLLITFHPKSQQVIFYKPATGDSINSYLCEFGGYGFGAGNKSVFTCGNNGWEERDLSAHIIGEPRSSDYKLRGISEIDDHTVIYSGWKISNDSTYLVLVKDSL